MPLQRIRHLKALIPSCVMMMVLLTFALKAIMPAGFMPAINKDGHTEIVICSGMGEKTILVPFDETPKHDRNDNSSGKLCAYDILASGKVLLSPSLPVIHAPVMARADAEFPNDPDYKTVKNPAFDARGPPAA